MRILLDTHIALWAITDSPRLNTTARELILSPDNTPYISSASLWEITIKHMLGRGNMPISGSQAAALFQASGYSELPVSHAHVTAIEKLPSHHADPFDRLLAAQAITEPLRLITHNEMLARYSDSIILI